MHSPSSPHRLRRPALVVERAIGEPAGKALRQLPGALRPALGFRGRCLPFASPASKAPLGSVGPGFLVFLRPSCGNCRGSVVWWSEQKAYCRPYWKHLRPPRALRWHLPQTGSQEKEAGGEYSVALKTENLCKSQTIVLDKRRRNLIFISFWPVDKKVIHGTFLVVQWIRVCLPMQGT